MRTGSMKFGKMPPKPAMPASAKPSSPSLPSGAHQKAATGAKAAYGLTKGKGSGRMAPRAGRVKDTDRDRDAMRDTDRDDM